jgi:hypothetical protein
MGGRASSDTKFFIMPAINLIFIPYLTIAPPFGKSSFCFVIVVMRYSNSGENSLRHLMSLPNYMGCLMEFYKSFIIILYENVFQNPELFPTQVSLSPKQSTIGLAFSTYFKMYKVVNRDCIARIFRGERECF